MNDTHQTQTDIVSTVLAHERQFHVRVFAAFAALIGLKGVAQR